MRRRLFFLMLAAAGLISCNNGKPNANEIIHKILIDKPGTEIKQGDFVSINVTIRNEADSIISSTYTAELPQIRILPKHKFKGDVFDAIQLLSEGDSATFKFPLDSVFPSQVRPHYFVGNKFTTYNLKVEKVIPKDGMSNEAFLKAIHTYMEGIRQAKKIAEPGRIKKYIADNKWKNVKTDSGLYYIVTKEGTGPLPVKNDTVIINYTAKLLSGKMFDTNVFEEADNASIIDTNRQYAPMGIPAGQRKVIAGWDRSLLLLKKDAEATVIVPSNLAYGADGDGGAIPPYSPLVYDLQIVKILHPKPVKK